MPYRRIVTACRTYHIILTGLCSQACGHCPFPAQFLEPIPSARKLRRLLRDAVQRRAVGVQISAGQGIAQNEAIVEACRHYGFDSFLDYLEMVARCIDQMALARRSPMIPVWDLGPLSLGEMRRLRQILLSLRSSLESMDPLLAGRPVFRNSPAKAPRWALEVLNSTAQVRIPVTVTTLVGIGESPESRRRTYEEIARFHARSGNVQAVWVRAFLPHARTLMANEPPVPKKTMVEAVALARNILPPDVAIQIQAFDTPEWAVDLVMAGADDIGDIPLQGTLEQLEEAEKLEAHLAAELAKKAIGIRYRLPIHDEMLQRGLYPLTLTTKLQNAMLALRNGASPPHAIKDHEFPLVRPTPPLTPPVQPPPTPVPAIAAAGLPLPAKAMSAKPPQAPSKSPSQTVVIAQNSTKAPVVVHTPVPAVALTPVSTSRPADRPQAATPLRSSSGSSHAESSFEPTPKRRTPQAEPHSRRLKY